MVTRKTQQRKQRWKRGGRRAQAWGSSAGRPKRHRTTSAVSSQNCAVQPREPSQPLPVNCGLFLTPSGKIQYPHTQNENKNAYHTFTGRVDMPQAFIPCALQGPLTVACFRAGTSGQQLPKHHTCLFTPVISGMHNCLHQPGVLVAGAP